MSGLADKAVIRLHIEVRKLEEDLRKAQETLERYHTLERSFRSRNPDDYGYGMNADVAAEMKSVRKTNRG